MTSSSTSSTTNSTPSSSQIKIVATARPEALSKGDAHPVVNQTPTSSTGNSTLEGGSEEGATSTGQAGASEFDPVQAMQWENGIGTLPGSNLKVGKFYIVFKPFISRLPWRYEKYVHFST